MKNDSVFCSLNDGIDSKIGVYNGSFLASGYIAYTVTAIGKKEILVAMN